MIEAYANARDVLPRPLLKKIQERFEGGLLWIPARARRRRKTREAAARDLQIRDERRGGASIPDLSRKYGLSEERIRQITRRPKRSS